MAQRDFRTHPLVVRQVDVARVVDVTPRMRRITLTGPQLAAFNNGEFDLPPFLSEGFDDHVKLVFAADGDIQAALPVQRARSIDWPPAPHRLGRDYTPRRWDPEAGELDLDFVKHSDGPAAGWAEAAKPGDVLHFAGPKSSLLLPEGIDWVLLAADETGLPAIGRYLDERPLDVPVQIVVEVRDVSARQDLPLREGDSIRWIATNEHAPSALPAAIRDTEWWTGQPYVWVAGESRSLIPLRRWLRRDKGLSPRYLNVTGYWHAEEAPVAGAVARVDPETLLSPLPWLATRAAIQLGLLDVLGDDPAAVSVIAARLSLPLPAVRALSAYLAEVDVLAMESDRLRLGPIAEELLGNDHLRDELFGDGFESRALDALTQLAPALRAGVSPWQHHTGRRLALDIEHDPGLYADRVSAVGGFGFVAGGVAELAAWNAASKVTVTGPGSVVLATAIGDRGRLPSDVAIAAPPAPLQVLRDQAEDLPVSFTAEEGARRADLVVSTMEAGCRDDAELTAHLTALSGHADRALLIDILRLTGPGGSGVAAEHDILALSGTGTGRRDAADIARIASAAGWRVVDHVALGWDYEVFELSR